MLIELTAALSVVAVVMLSTAAVLRAQSLDLLVLYEERVARAVAAGQAELLEAAGKGGKAEGRTEIRVEDPGWENLREAACTAELTSLEPGLWRAMVVVTWRDSRNGTRRVEVGTLLWERP